MVKGNLYTSMLIEFYLGLNQLLTLINHVNVYWTTYMASRIVPIKYNLDEEEKPVGNDSAVSRSDGADWLFFVLAIMQRE